MVNIKLVEQFHKLMGHPILLNPTIPSIDRCNLRFDLLDEELKEFKEAYEEGDIVAVFDALLDIDYVLKGAILEFGMQRAFQEGFEEVQRSNMSKECKSHEEAVNTAQNYEIERGILTEIKELKNGKYKVVNIKNDKTLKSINYSPADLKHILDKN